MIGQVLANHFREDLERAGIGSGRHGFEFRSALDLSGQAIEVRRSLDGAALEFSGRVSARVRAADDFDNATPVRHSASSSGSG